MSTALTILHGDCRDTLKTLADESVQCCVTSQPYSGAHFATFPPALIQPCILAGCPAGGVVLDPFGGSGTSGQVALELGRNAILCELNGDYLKLIEQRTAITPGLPLAA